MKIKKEYALYKGEECLGIGTVKELSEKFNVKEKTIMFYNTPSHKKRERKCKLRTLICLD